jgi:exosortase
MVEAFFRIAGVPYHREGFVFILPGISIRVAEECSGIHSTLALLITTVLASYIFLKKSWKRVVLCIAVVPIAIFKNGLRIATLSVLAIYVNPAFLYGNLHHRGGIVFFIIALLPMALLLNLLRRGDNKIPLATEVSGT